MTKHFKPIVYDRDDAFLRFPVMRAIAANPAIAAARPGTGRGAVFLLHLRASAVAAVETMIRLGMAPADILCIGKAYRYPDRSAVENRLRRLGVTVVPVEQLKEALAAYAVRLGSKTFVVCEDGGHVALELYANPELLSRCLGFVEQTSKGIWRVEAAVPDPTLPHLSLPASILKREFESGSVGDAVVAATRTLLGDGAGLERMNAAVIGSAGVIGASVVDAFRETGVRIAAYDRHPPLYYDLKNHRRLQVCGSLAEAITGRDLIVGCTGSQIFALADIKYLKDGVILVSAGSEQTEFPLNALRQLSERVDPFLPPGAQQPHGSVFTLRPNGKTVIVLEDGRPVNLGLAAPSEEDPCFDLIVGLVVAGGIEILRGGYAGRRGFIDDFDAITSRYDLANLYIALHAEQGR